MTRLEDPYARRARTHRRHPDGPYCQRCEKPWPCPKQGTQDTTRPARFLMLVGAVLAAAVVAAASVAGFAIGAMR